MKLKQYLTEELDPDVVVKILKKDCTPFIKDVAPHINDGPFKLFRAMERNTGSISKIKTRMNRKPKDTPQEIHDMLDKEFKRGFGWKARSQGVFVTGDIYQAEAFGSYVHYFWPIGQYSFIYHPNINDLTEELKDMDILKLTTATPGSKYSYEIRPTHTKKELEKEFNKLVRGYKQFDIEKARGSFNEIIFRVKSYYIMNTKYLKENWDYLRKGLWGY